MRSEAGAADARRTPSGTPSAHDAATLADREDARSPRGATGSGRESGRTTLGPDPFAPAAVRPVGDALRSADGADRSGHGGRPAPEAGPSAPRTGPFPSAEAPIASRSGPYGRTAGRTDPGTGSAGSPTGSAGRAGRRTVSVAPAVTAVPPMGPTSSGTGSAALRTTPTASSRRRRP
ncbi:hypothetical protein GCM10010358_49200 [Streptomyces minutiscleroticus]|uniref:Uncharacterized protein n=1 Tax=Streptomyces minutiscleroticus TaxID=68238 RepID=A0A918U3Z6_9ACTN|nr:hypothetical protein GCM10010358_49200 [Streptomyces minutiscleroticus]